MVFLLFHGLNRVKSCDFWCLNPAFFMVKAPFFVDPPTPQLGRRSRGAGGGQKRAARHQTVDADRSKRGGLGTDMENHWKTIGNCAKIIGKPLWTMGHYWNTIGKRWKTIGKSLEDHWKLLTQSRKIGISLDLWMIMIAKLANRTPTIVYNIQEL